MPEACHDVCMRHHSKHWPLCIEASLQALTTETLPHATSNSDDGARLDIQAQDFWGAHHRHAFFDVRVFYPNATFYRNLQLGSAYRRHEKEKKSERYEDRIRVVEHGSFIPLVFSTSGGMGPLATTAYKRLASLIASKRDQPYKVMAWLRCHLCFRSWGHPALPSEEHTPELDTPPAAHQQWTSLPMKVMYPYRSLSFLTVAILHDSTLPPSSLHVLHLCVCLLYAHCYTCTTGTIPLLQVLYHYCRYYTTTAGTIPLLQVLYHYCRYYTTTAGTIPLLQVLYHYCRYYTTTAGTIPLLQVLYHYCRYYSTTAGTIPLLQVVYHYCR